jgi:hypothetical protein
MQIIAQLITFLLLFSTTAVLSSPASNGRRFLARQASTPRADLGPSTNAVRMARGLPPKAPRSLYSPTRKFLRMLFLDMGDDEIFRCCHGCKASSFWQRPLSLPSRQEWRRWNHHPQLGHHVHLYLPRWWLFLRCSDGSAPEHRTAQLSGLLCAPVQLSHLIFPLLFVTDMYILNLNTLYMFCLTLMYRIKFHT